MLLDYSLNKVVERRISLKKEVYKQLARRIQIVIVLCAYLSSS
jgi:hypothetical protein